MIRFRDDVVPMQAAFDSIFAVLLCQKSTVKQTYNCEKLGLFKIKNISILATITHQERGSSASHPQSLNITVYSPPTHSRLVSLRLNHSQVMLKVSRYREVSDPHVNNN